jgi:type IV secretory pathway TrbF-like protein
VADKDIDKPGQQTLGAKFKRAGKATQETTGEFLGHWGHNITLGKRVKFVYIPSLAMATAMLGSAVYQTATDTDPTVDPTLLHHTTPIHQTFDATPSYQETTLENGEVQSVFSPSETSSVSVIKHANEFFALIEHQGQFTLYSYDEENKAFVRLENPEVAEVYIKSIAQKLEEDSSRFGEFHDQSLNQNILVLMVRFQSPTPLKKKMEASTSFVMVTFNR